MTVWLCFLNVKKRSTNFLGEASNFVDSLSALQSEIYFSVFL